MTSGYNIAVSGRGARGSEGFTLFEVLIAILILVLGLLGVAALNANAVGFNQSAYMRSQAVNLAYDVADRMRTNRQRARAGDYNVGYADPATPLTCTPDLSPTGTIAAQDLAGWKNEVACMLPDGDASIVLNGSVFTVSVRWNDSRGEEAAEVFTMETRL
jgi:type IV pilus assembly protein PilV